MKAVDEGALEESGLISTMKVKRGVFSFTIL